MATAERRSARVYRNCISRAAMIPSKLANRPSAGVLRWGGRTRIPASCSTRMLRREKSAHPPYNDMQPAHLHQCAIRKQRGNSHRHDQGRHFQARKRPGPNRMQARAGSQGPSHVCRCHFAGATFQGATRSPIPTGMQASYRIPVSTKTVTECTVLDI